MISLLAGFATAIIAGFLTLPDFQANWVLWKAVLIGLPAIGSVSVAILSQFKIFEVWKLREIAKSELSRILDEAKIKVIPMGVDYEKFSISRKRNHRSNYSFKKHFIGEDKNKLILNCAYKNYEKGTVSAGSDLASDTGLERASACRGGG